MGYLTLRRAEGPSRRVVPSFSTPCYSATIGTTLQRISLMVPDRLPFPLAEYEGRIARTRKAMAERGLDVVITSDPSNMAWLTGYDGWSFYVHQAVLLGLEGEPVWWGRRMDGFGARRTAFMHQDNIAGYPDDYVQSTTRHPMQHLARLIAERGLDGARIGVEMDNYWFTAQAYEVLTAALPNARFVDATALVNWQRMVKSPREIAFMQRAGRIVERVYEAVFEMVEPGLPKNRLVAEIYRIAIEGADGHWGDYPAIVPMMGSGLDATAPHLTWDDQPFRAGEGTFFELCGCYRRYHCPLSRTVFLGAMPEKYRAAEHAVLAGTEAALDKARPGNTCEEVAIAFFDTLKKHGFEKDSRTGYSIGLSYPPDWGERTLSLRRGDLTVLEENMTIHFMPALWLDDGGIEISESILIGPQGPEMLAKVPRQVVVKG
jgi:ectoine hydrolase